MHSTIHIGDFSDFQIKEISSYQRVSTLLEELLTCFWPFVLVFGTKKNRLFTRRANSSRRRRAKIQLNFWISQKLSPFFPFLLFVFALSKKRRKTRLSNDDEEVALTCMYDNMDDKTFDEFSDRKYCDFFQCTMYHHTAMYVHEF